MSQAFRLYRLQQIDSQTDKLKAHSEEIQTALQDDQALRAAEAEAVRRREEHDAALKELQKAETVVQDQRVKIETTEASLYGGKVRNPKELQDLQNEASALKRYLVVLEDRQLEAMMVEEQASQARQEAQVALVLAQQKHFQTQTQLNDELNRLLKDLPNLDIERQAAISSITPDELQLYEKLRKQKRGVAVSMIQNKACTACGSTLSATLLDASSVSGLVTRCETCGRILYMG